MTAPGRVYIVGAGPGDPELLTVKGARLLGAAGLVVYAGSLVNERILSLCRDDCALLDSASMTLEEQADAIADAVGRGVTVVRLHTGDPSLYGAISEQLRLFEEKKIDYEIVPGVSSLQGAAARLGIEFTVPGGTQTLICTRAPGRTPVPDAEDIEALASHRATLAVFLSAGMVDSITQKCVAAGLPPDTPAAWIYRATWEDERSGVTTLRELADSMESSGIDRHALVIIGDCLRRDSSARSRLYSPDFSHGARGRKCSELTS